MKFENALSNELPSRFVTSDPILQYRARTLFSYSQSYHNSLYKNFIPASKLLPSIISRTVLHSAHQQNISNVFSCKIFSSSSSHKVKFDSVAAI